MNLQKNKPPPTEEELAEEEKKFLQSREEEYAAIRADNARKREEDLIAKAQVSVEGDPFHRWQSSPGSVSSRVPGMYP